PPVSSGVRSAGCNLIATRVFGMSETIAITGKSVKLFKGHYTRMYRAVRVTFQVPLEHVKRSPLQGALEKAYRHIGSLLVK
ncbi:MAG: hypothetical protein ACREYE_28595, partial [Gammaproteobacteria bacterium]